MRLLDRYLFRQSGLAFLACLVGLTALIWVTQALRDFDLVTSQGQTALIFLIVTSLAIPSLVVVIAPVSLFLAAVWTLNRLNGDSELVVANAAGVSGSRLARPFAILALIVAVLVGSVTLYGQPESMRELRFWLTQVRADLISKIVREGQFTTVDQGLTFHVRERRPNGTLLGIFVQDARAKDQTLTYIAERGQIVDSNGGTILVLEKGSVQRQVNGEEGDANIVVFDRYAFDLSQLIEEPDVMHFKPRERYTSELWRPDPSDADTDTARGRLRAELVQRFVAPLYPVAFMAIALAALGQARTTRQSRGTAIALAVLAVAAVRIGGFAAESWSARSGLAIYVTFAIPLLATLVAGVLVARSARLSWPARRRPRLVARTQAA